MKGNQDSRVLPWHDVNFGISPKYFQDEHERSKTCERTSPCKKNCTTPCGSCNDEYGTVSDSIQFDSFSARITEIMVTSKPKTSVLYRGILKFIKVDTAMFISHLNLMDVFSKTLVRANLPIVFSNGFNPQPRVEIAQPLPLGIASRAEYAGIYLSAEVEAEFLPASINPFLPPGIVIIDAMVIKQEEGRKAPSLSSLPPGSRVRVWEAGLAEGPFTHKSIIRQAVSPQGIELDIRVGSTKEVQAFSFLKEVFGDRPSSWPKTERVEAMVFDETSNTLVHYFETLKSFYGNI
jgi:radical SAM-linked protein